MELIYYTINTATIMRQKVPSIFTKISQICHDNIAQAWPGERVFLRVGGFTWNSSLGGQVSGINGKKVDFSKSGRLSFP